MKLWNTRLSFLIIVIFIFVGLHFSSEGRRLPSTTSMEEFQERFRQLRTISTGEKYKQIYRVSLKKIPGDLVFPALRFSRGGRSALVTAVAPFSGERSAFVTAVAPYSGERAALVILEGGGSFCSGCLWVVSRCRFEAAMGNYPFE
ncbi:Uncharacterized protein Rs2_42326 [Raphanus sativus]|nr:Uncharacterized protein Rs2_42326 [Raphanus sativus]